MKKYILTALVIAGALVSNVNADIVEVSMNMPAGCAIVAHNLSEGNHDSLSGDLQVAALQNYLRDQGFYSFKTTGYFGSITSKAVKAFQKANGLPPTGFVGPLTRAKINVCVTPPPASSLNVTSPKNGEVWKQGTVQTINWTDRNVYIQAQKYDITISPKSLCVAGRPCPLMMIKPYTIATSTTLSTTGYSWVVGSNTEAGRTIPDGDYIVTVCTTGGSNCAQSGVVTLSSTAPVATSTISSLTPVSGKIGTTVYIVGSNLGNYQNINFGFGYIPKDQITYAVATDGSQSGQVAQLGFKVPSSLAPSCFYATPVHCMIASMMTAPGTYNVSVTMTDGTVTNSMPFTVVAN